MQVKKPEAVSKEILERSPGSSRLRLSRASWVMAGLAVCLLDTAARAQYPQPHIEQLSERSGLVMRYVGTPEHLPADPLRDNFYNLRYADRGLIKHPDGIKDQGLYGLE